MIKILYIASIPFLIILILIFFILQLTYRSPIINQELTSTTENLTQNNPILAESSSSFSKTNPQMPSEIWKNNIFDSNRGVMAEGKSSVALKDITLLGVFGGGKISGAVFLISSLTASTGRSYGAPTGGYGGAQPPYGSPGQETPPKPKMVFLIGERLPNGFVLKSVTKDSAVLQGGDGTVTLNMEFADESSSKRMLEAQRTNLQQQTKIIESGKQGSGGTSSSGTTSSNVVIRNTPESQKQGSY